MEAADPKIISVSMFPFTHTRCTFVLITGLEKIGTGGTTLLHGISCDDKLGVLPITALEENWRYNSCAVNECNNETTYRLVLWERLLCGHIQVDLPLCCHRSEWTLFSSLGGLLAFTHLHLTTLGFGESLLLCYSLFLFVAFYSICEDRYIIVVR